MDRQGTWEARFHPCVGQAGEGRPAISIQTPARHRACKMPGARKRGRTLQDAHGTGRRNSKPTGCGIGSLSALTVPVKAGNRDRRDPLEESGASHGQNRGRETREDAVPRKRVTATNPDSRSGLAKLPCEEPDALMSASSDLRGEGLGNDPSYPATRRGFLDGLNCWCADQSCPASPAERCDPAGRAGEVVSDLLDP